MLPWVCFLPIIGLFFIQFWVCFRSVFSVFGSVFIFGSTAESLIVIQSPGSQVKGIFWTWVQTHDVACGVNKSFPNPKSLDIGFLSGYLFWKNSCVYRLKLELSTSHIMTTIHARCFSNSGCICWFCTWSHVHMPPTKLSDHRLPFSPFSYNFRGPTTPCTSRK